MVQINFAQKQINAKIVYYGPGMSGKTTNLEVVHQRAPSNNRGELTSISTDGDRTLFFDYMPLDLGTIAGMKTCFQMYTVPGQVYYNSTRKLVLQGVDGVIFVADSSAKGMEQNLASLRNLEENLNEYGKSLATLPHVIQFNKRDLPDALPLGELEAQLNHNGAQTFEACAATGEGVFPTLKGLAAAVLKHIQNDCGGGGLGRTGFHAAAARPGSGVASSGPQPRPASMPAGGAVPAPTRAPAVQQPSRPQPASAQGAAAPLKQTGFTPRTAAVEPVASSAGQLMEPASAALEAPQKPKAARPRPAGARAPAPQAAAQPAPQAASQGAAANGAPQAGRAKSAQAAQPGRRTRSAQAKAPGPAPAPALKMAGPSKAKTAAFVLTAAAVGAVLAKVVLDFI